MSGFGQIAVVGLGLLGGSVALGARQRGIAKRIVGATRDPRVREQALGGGSVDAILPLAEVGREAELAHDTRAVLGRQCVSSGQRFE